MTGKEAYQFIIDILEEEGELPLAAPYGQAFDYLLEQGLVKPLEPRKSRFHAEPSKRDSVIRYINDHRS